MWPIKKLFTLFYFTAAIYGQSNESSNSDKNMGEVIFVNVMFRHGARTPLTSYPNDPNKEAFLGKGGQLTNVGKMQTYNLGRWLRKRYDSILPQNYMRQAIRVMSTECDRVIMSAQCCMAGLYPPQGEQVWNPRLMWQPVPIHNIKFVKGHDCKEYHSEKNRIMNSKAVRKYYKQLNYKWITSYLYNYTGIIGKNESVSQNDVFHVYDTLLVQSEHNLTLPEWSRAVYPDPMEEVVAFGYGLLTWNRKLRRLLTGPIIKYFIKNMKQKAHGHFERVMHVYAAHDSTLVNLLNTLEVWDRKLPPYAACVMLELRRDSGGDHFVTLFYRTSDKEKPRLLTIPGCDAACPLNDFIAITSPIIPRNWTEECKLLPNRKENNCYL